MNTTPNINLSTYTSDPNDKFNLMVTFNDNMTKIDTAVGAQNDAIDVIEETAGSAVTTANTASATAEEALTTAEGKTSINDNVASATTTYSSNKINNLLDAKTSINDTTASASTTYSSNKIDDLLDDKASINDTTASNTSTYSSNKINSLLSVSAIDFSSKTVMTTGTVENQRLVINYTVPSDGYYQISYILHKAYIMMSIGGNTLFNGVMIGSGNDFAGDGTSVVSPIYYLKAGQTMHAIAYLEVSGDTANEGEILKFNPL